ncbi:acetolactate decarboxylase [uncultured Psychroserpens sp.]|uniref:acetolactate decarboxylase n=1 Tax=uncultured Psychroserpens sp. TaxID=255436 RepID=UPI0026239496|nr:acetolactate decarboxylase [uncultured Psychroserpens sp.]
MNKTIYKIAIMVTTLVVLSCQSNEKKTSNTEVNHSGALRTIMSGNISSTISLDSLSNKEHFYALGAIENLKGEIQIFDSKASNSLVVNDAIKINDSYDVNASLLVYAQIEEWNTFQMNDALTKSELEAKIFELAQANNVDTEKPFPFLIEGTVSSLDWHVINWKDGDMVHNHKKHKEAGLNGKLTNSDVLILGFYSTKHKAIFTHHTTNMHMHFKTTDDSIAGHVDNVVISEVQIKLPKQ